MMRVAPLSVPVLHFVDSPCEQEFIDALGANLINTSTLGDYECEDEEMRACSIKTYALVNNVEKTFCAVQRVADVTNMCTSARMYNTILKRLLPETKLLLSVDPRGEQLESRPRDHSRFCDYIWTLTQLLRYLDVDENDIRDVEALREIIGVRHVDDDVVNQAARREIMQHFIMRQLIQGNGEGRNNNNNDNDAIRFISLNTLQPERQYVAPEPVNKKIKIDKAWDEQLRQENELNEAAADRYACIACVKYDKTIVLLPCKHQSYCDLCFREMMERTDVPKTCPECRKPFEGIARVYN